MNRDDGEDYIFEVFQEQFRYFGPLPAKIAEIAPEDTVRMILVVMELNPREKLTPFSRTTLREVSKKDNVFISKMMKLD